MRSRASRQGTWQDLEQSPKGQFAPAEGETGQEELALGELRVGSHTGGWMAVRAHLGR